MALFVALAPGVEVNGAAVLSILMGMESFQGMGEEILARHGIVDPRAGAWYRQQSWLDAFREIAQRVGPSTLKSIGKQIPGTALWPADVQTIAGALASIDVAYHMNHRYGPVGHYRFIPTGSAAGKMICSNPYPCEFDMGIIEATARRFALPKQAPAVSHDDSQPCRKLGGDTCTYLITW